jgi:hypothetical protein
MLAIRLRRGPHGETKSTPHAQDRTMRVDAAAREAEAGLGDDAHQNSRIARAIETMTSATKPFK